MPGRHINQELPAAQQLSLFLARVEELLNTRMIQTGGLDIGFSISADRVKGSSFEFREPHEDDLRSFLLTFRHFVSDNEPVFVNRIHAVCWQQLNSDKLKAELSKGQAYWRTAGRHGPLAYVEDGDSYSPVKMLDLWINGRYFHSDQRKAAQLAQLSAPGLLFTRQILLNYIIEATRYILLLRNVIVVARKEGILAA